MLANDKLPPFKWAIVYFNRFIPLGLAIFGAFYLLYQLANGGDVSTQMLINYLLLVGASFLIKEVLYQNRATIYGSGQSRFYWLLAIFYSSWLVNAFIFNDFKEVPLYASISYLNSISPLDLINIQLFVFVPAIAVIWYLFDIELDRQKRREMDIKALLITEDRIQRWDANLVLAVTGFSLLVISLYSIVVGLMCVIVCFVCLLLPEKLAKTVYLAMGVICILFGLNVSGRMINFANGWWIYWHEHGFISMLAKQLHSVSATFKYGVTLIATPYFLIGWFAAIRLKQEDLNKIEEYAKVAEKEKALDGDMPFGINAETKQEVKLTVKEFNTHALYAGTTGGGKTRAILSNVEYCAEKGIPLILLDGKGSPDLPEKMFYLAKKYNRKFKVFTLKPEDLEGELAGCLAAYHPFSTGTFTEWKNRIMSLFAAAEGRGQEHYVLGETTALNTILALLYQSNFNIDLKILLETTQDLPGLKELAATIGDSILCKNAESISEESLGDIKKVLELFVISSYGHLFDTSKHENVIKIQDSVMNDEIVLFMFDSATYKEDTKKIAKMVISDINSAFSTIKKRNNGLEKTCFCIFDEFASYASSNLSDTLTLQRSNGMHAIVGTQSLTTVAEAGADTARVAEELIACCSTYLILQLQHDKDIERISKIIGTKTGYEVTRQLDISEGVGATGMGSSKEIKEFVVHPDEIRKLRGEDGTGILVRKAYGQAPFKLILRSVKVSD